jgi:hypothetical protein
MHLKGQYQPKLLNFFLGKNAIVSLENLAVTGKPVSYQDSERGKPHLPSVLVLATSSGIVLIRGN